jgi:hypothetical protein
MEEAAKVLERQQLLIWHSVDRNESLPQTRLHYERVLYGISDGGAGSAKGKAPPGTPNAVVWPLHSSMNAGGEARVRAGLEFGPRPWVRAVAVSTESTGGGGDGSSGGGSSGERTVDDIGGELRASRGGTPIRKKSAKRRVDGTPERKSPRVAEGGVRKRKGGGGA